MLAGGYSWRLFFYVEFAFACALLIFAFFFVEETAYKREEVKARLAGSTSYDEKIASADTQEYATNVPERKSFMATLKPWSSVDHSAPFFSVMLRSFTYFLVPCVFWVVTTYGKAESIHQIQNSANHNQVSISVLEPWLSTTLSQSKLLAHLTIGVRQTLVSLQLAISLDTS